AHSLHQAEARWPPRPQRPRRALLLPRSPDNRPHAEGALEARATTAGLGSRPDSIDSIQFIFGEDAGDPTFSPAPPRPASMPWLRGRPRDKLVGEGEVPGSETKGSPNRTSRRDSKRGAKQEPCGTDNDGDGEDDDVSQRVSKRRLVVDPEAKGKGK
uniref:Uncharacterized protein n=2 Tax=Triticum urartu TaxID=4572 RepID=A0A8R7UAG5_TRIUA